MSFDEERREEIFRKTDGRCHICRKRLALRNYGLEGERGAWEIEHSNPRSKGGTDRLNNLYAACISCNRAKSDSTTAAARAENGFRRAPYSKERKKRNTVAGSGAGALLGLLAPPPIRLGVVIALAIVGAVLGAEWEPD